MLEKGITRLSENDSKKILSDYGIPVTREKVVTTENDAVAAAGEIGYPVVLKGSGEELAHKTELNLVVLDVRDEKDVRAAYKKLTSSSTGNVREVLVQQMIKGDREVVIGMSRDPQFGPCVMFGIGGIFTEILEDVVFGIAPLSRSDAMDMLDAIRGTAILDGFRGKPAIDRNALADILVAVGAIGMNQDRVREIDINPLKFIDGKPVAVDALIVLDNVPHREKNFISPANGFGDGFPPESIGIVGVSRTVASDIPGYTGIQMFRMLKSCGFKGRVYPINPKADEIDGEKAYPDVASVPERLDLVIIAVSAHIVPGVLEDCVKARTRCVQISSSGFSETGKDEGIILENRIKDIIMEGGLQVIGPNCIGFHVPSKNITMHQEFTDYLEPGPVAFISQSGGHAVNFLFLAPGFDIRVSKVISYGNALTTDSHDLISYLADDPETQIICMYLEGVKNAGRLFAMVKEICAEKPVIILKGGLTDSGARAAASHTGSMAGDKKIWDTFFRQTNAMQVNTLQELAELTTCFLKMEKPMSRMQAAVLGHGGGATVANGDICAREGIVVPPLTSKTINALSEFIPLVNQGIANPLDVPGVMFNLDALHRTCEVLNADPEIDIIILVIQSRIFFTGQNGDFLSGYKAFFKKYMHEHPEGKPLAVALLEEVNLSWTETCIREFREIGIFSFSSLSGACRALRRFAGYHKHVSS